MAELSAVNSSESKHRLDNMKLIGREHLKQSEYKKILIVDDNSDIAFTLCLELESDPIMQVYSYDNPVTALLDFKPNFYDLLLIDINMPLMDGFQLAHKLLQRHQCQGLFYDFRRDQYGGSRRSASTQEYRLFYQKTKYCRTAVKTY
jgi:CheY-like chemotaxis protein